MAIENTVSSDILAAFVDCEESFQLPPIQCENMDTHIQNFHLERYTIGYTVGNHVL